MNSQTERIPDQQLWHLFQNGNRDAFAELYRRFVPLLYKYGVQITNNHEVINDSIHDFYTKLWTRKQHLFPSIIKSYLLVAFRRTLQQKIANHSPGTKKSEKDISEYTDLQSTISHEDQLINDQVFSERRVLLHKAVESLSRRQREIIFLRFYGENSYEEISKIMGIETAGAYTLMQKSIVRLKKYLNKSFLDISTLVED